MEEIWRGVPGYESFYLVSNFGRIRTIPRMVYSFIQPNKTRMIKDKVHVPNDNGRGYKYFTIKINGGKKHNFYIHKAVALAFLDNPNGYNDINHKDCNKANNRLENLEWCSKKQNMRHAFDNGLMNIVKGENKPGRKLTEEIVLEIRRLVKEGKMMQIHIADKFGISRGYIWHIMNDKWQHI